MDQPGEAYVDYSFWRRKVEMILRMHAEQERYDGKGPLPPEPLYPESDPSLQYVSLPYLRTSGWSNKVLTGGAYDLVREWFAMNETDPECCPPPEALPHPDEIVWHFRNFRRESANLASKGYVEVSPPQAVEYLFRPLALAKSRRSSRERPQRVAMVSRFTEDLQSYVEALEAQRSPRFQVRVIENGTGASDFCFLKHARHTLVFVHMSTYAGWASVLGNAKQSLLYVVNSTQSQRRAERANKTLLQSVGRIDWVESYPRFQLAVIPEGPNDEAMRAAADNQTANWRKRKKTKDMVT
jgi:hypothetical protein